MTATDAYQQPQPVIVRSKCPVCLGRKTTADSVHQLHRCANCAGRGYVLVEVES